MNSHNSVPLERRFSPGPRLENDSEEQIILEILGDQNNKSWPEIDRRYRTIILAEAGAGKTFEMTARAKTVENEGRPAFFIRIEDIVDDFKQAFEVGSTEGFEQWLSSQSEAWFFLDSVDEARLSNPRDFEKAIRRFANAIKPSQLRAHICISSRPYAWRQKSDRELIERYLPFKKPQSGTTDQVLDLGESSQPSENELEIFRLGPLDEGDIRLFAEHRSVPDIDTLIEELERSNVMSLAERPFDLENILDKWKTTKVLGGRSELLGHIIKLRLNESDPDNIKRRPLEPDKARGGARMLSAAVILCDKPGIQVPDNTHERTGIQADTVLSDWGPGDIQTLLERAIFNDVIYGSVRFRHREIREFLAAEWFAELLKTGNARHRIEATIFREQYGENIVSPRLRPILPWLILKDRKILKRALNLHPEIAVEGGDPACLPLSVRENILNGILAGIAERGKRSSGQDNSAIARIAQPDMIDTTLSLINKYSAHDDAIFFLGRLVWQGKMRECGPPLSTIAVDPKRGISARMAAMRAVMSCGTTEQGEQLWQTILTDQAEIPRMLLAELLQWVSTDQEGVSHLLTAVEKLPAYRRFEVTGLKRALHGYIDRLPISNSDATQPMTKLVDSLKEILNRSPHDKRLSCRISKEFQWLLEPAVHAVERLVSMRADATMQDGPLSILLNSPAIRESLGKRFDDYKDNLQELVPAWPELNDTLFWMRVKTKRACLEKEGKRLNCFYQVLWPEHYWSFGPDSFPRVLVWLKTCELVDDRLVALTLAFRIYTEAERPTNWLDKLQVAVNGDDALRVQLDELLNPTISEEQREYHQQNLQDREEFEHQRRKKEKNRSEWVQRLKMNPGLIQNPPQLKPGELSSYQYSLMCEIEENAVHTKRAQGTDWEFLIDEFGDDVAHVYRDAAMNHWRDYNPGLPSEGVDTSSIPVSLSFALTGLEIEAREYHEFPTHLDELEIDHALRYITWEIDGFPGWLEAMHRVKPQSVLEAIQTEIYWELANTEPDQKSYGLLYDLTYYAPWLHQALIQPLWTWLRKNDPPNADTLRYILHILKSGGMEPAKLGALAKSKTTTTQCDEALSQWYAIWVDAQPDSGIPALSEWLTKLDTSQSSHSAQVFVTALIGNRHGAATGPNIGNFQQIAEHLKSLYVLMHSHIPVEGDINRANTGAYSPELRDHAQEARSRILNLLSEVPGKATYIALKELAEEHPDPDYQSWMKELAYRRAVEDSDLEQPWIETQVCEFDSRLIRTPATQHQLFDLTVNRLTDMKNWLEQGDTSPYATWKRAKDEPEMCNLVAGWLEQNADNLFTVSQEAEIANKQRIDIWLQNPNAGHPIPIEMKLLDKGWTGPKLCERLRNQLVGDYLRDGTDRYGVMLLIWQGIKPKRWKIDGKLVDISTLQDTLKEYWNKISGCYPEVSDIQVIIVDLTLRATKSKSQE